jgi:heat shock protein HtpX
MSGTSQAGACPECGTPNPGFRTHCRQCGAPLKGTTGAQPSPKVLRRTDFLAAARTNRANTVRLLAVLLAVATVLGYLMGWNIELLFANGQTVASPDWSPSSGGLAGGTALLMTSAGWTALALSRGDRIMLKLSGAERVSAEQEPVLHNVVAEMAIAAGIPRPRVYLIETDALNAFATGMRPQTAAVAVTRGLLDTLSRDELQGVIGHEFGHIVNWDIRYATVVGVTVGLVALVSDAALRGLRYSRGRSNSPYGVIAVVALLLFALLAPLAAKLVQMAISRQREFLADATSVRLTRNPLGLIGALEKLGRAARPFPGASGATQHLFIVNPFRSFGDKALALFATHPPIERRIARLRNLGDKISSAQP